MFANRYLERNKPKPLIADPPDSELGLSVIIPCYREPDILHTLESLKNCEKPQQSVEVIIVVNHSEVEEETIKAINRRTKVEIENWIAKNPLKKIRFFVVGPIALSKKWAGAGLARKSGMDEAVRRFNGLGKKEGLIISLDADTFVETNYLNAIEKHFIKNPKDVATIINFQHRTTALSDKHLEGIRFYELYMKYYKEALCFTGYPYAMFTVGSAFAVKADAYVKRGGMNRRQAGEDFYFLQNLAQLGAIGELNKTTVYPSARVSDRVPFGTGPILQKWLSGEEDLSITYNFLAFEDLKYFFDRKEHFYRSDESEYLQLINDLPVPVKKFLLHDNFRKELDDLNKNCSSRETFSLRFFQKFNAFKILKFLNFGHEQYYQKADLKEQLNLLHKKDSHLKS